MKTNKVSFKKVVLACCTVIISSCGGGSTESVHIPGDFKPEIVITNQNRLQKILTKEMVAEVANVPADKIEAQVENNINQQGQYTVLYSWPTGNTLKVGDGKHEIAEYHSISIGLVQQMTAEVFEKHYGTNEGLQEQVNQMVQQENFNKEVGIAEAKYIAAYAGTRKAERLENVATAAFWETPMNALHVLAKDAAFTLTANFGDDAALAKKKSVALVNAILNSKN